MSLDGVSYRDMAEVLGLSESNVGVKINRIKNQLAQTLKGKINELE
jgi:RNA polymerase sigma-70 factor (ECF subfamily)